MNESVSDSEISGMLEDAFAALAQKHPELWNPDPDVAFSNLEELLQDMRDVEPTIPPSTPDRDSVVFKTALERWHVRRQTSD